MNFCAFVVAPFCGGPCLAEHLNMPKSASANRSQMQNFWKWISTMWHNLWQMKSGNSLPKLRHLCQSCDFVDFHPKMRRYISIRNLNNKILLLKHHRFVKHMPWAWLDETSALEAVHLLSPGRCSGTDIPPEIRANDSLQSFKSQLDETYYFWL